MWSKTERGHFSFPRSSLKMHSSKQLPKQANDFNKSDDVTMGVTYCKIPKISPGAYIFQRPFLRGLFLEGVIFGGAYLRREICVSKLIGQTLYLEGNLLFLLCFTLYLRAISKYKPLGGLIFRGVI